MLLAQTAVDLLLITTDGCVYRQRCLKFSYLQHITAPLPWAWSSQRQREAGPWQSQGRSTRHRRQALFRKLPHSLLVPCNAPYLLVHHSQSMLFFFSCFFLPTALLSTSGLPCGVDIRTFHSRPATDLEARLFGVKVGAFGLGCGGLRCRGFGCRGLCAG